MFNFITREIISQLCGNGHTSMFVGGCVRDYTIGLNPNDIDIATSATPAEVIGIFSNSKFKTIPTGINYGTITLIHSGKEYQVTTLRKDISSDGRKPKVHFSKSFEEDSNRRDFSFNALYMGLDGKILDFHGGRNDITKGIVRFIGDPESRIIEDHLRILRYFRFFSNFSKTEPIDNYCNILQNTSGLIKKLSRERVKAEFLKILQSKNVIDTLFFMHQTHVLCQILEYDLSKIDNEIFCNLPSMAKLSVISRSNNIKSELRLSNSELKLFQFFRETIVI